jgi:hypothetical protein
MDNPTYTINETLEKVKVLIDFFNTQLETNVPIIPDKVESQFNSSKLINSIYVEHDCFDINTLVFSKYQTSMNFLDLNIERKIEEKMSKFDATVNYINDIRNQLTTKLINLKLYQEFLKYAYFQNAFYNVYLSILSKSFVVYLAGFKPFFKKIEIRFSGLWLYKYENAMRDITNDELQKYYLVSGFNQNVSMINTLNKLRETRQGKKKELLEEEIDQLNNFLKDFMVDAIPIYRYDNSIPNPSLSVKSIQRQIERLNFKDLDEFLNVWNMYTSNLIEKLEQYGTFSSVDYKLEKIDFEDIQKLASDAFLTSHDLKTLETLSDETLKYTTVEKFVTNYTILSNYQNIDSSDFLKRITQDVLQLFIDKKYLWSIIIDIYFNLIMTQIVLLFQVTIDSPELETLSEKQRRDFVNVERFKLNVNIESILKLSKRPPKTWLTVNYLRNMVFLKEMLEWCENNGFDDNGFDDNGFDDNGFGDENDTLCTEYDKFKHSLYSYYDIPSEQMISKTINDVFVKLKNYSDKMSAYKKEFNAWIDEQRTKLKSVTISVLDIPSKSSKQSNLSTQQQRSEQYQKQEPEPEPEPKQESEQKQEPLPDKVELPTPSKSVLKRLPYILLLISTGVVAAAVNYEWFVSLLNSKESEIIPNTLQHNISTIVSKPRKSNQKEQPPRKLAPIPIQKPGLKPIYKPQLKASITRVEQFINQQINTEQDVITYLPTLIHEMFSRIPGMGLKEGVICLFALSTLMGLKKLLPLLISNVTLLFAKESTPTIHKRKSSIKKRSKSNK